MVKKTTGKAIGAKKNSQIEEIEGEKLKYSPREKLRTSKMEKRPIAVTKI